MKSPRFDNLPDWLRWQETLHPREIELGLERVRQVAGVLDILQPAPYVVTVGGTNGKGSSVHMLAEALMTDGYSVAAYTSPHLLKYNERICFNRQPVRDGALCEAFDAVDDARGETSLTYFEFGTLAALWLMCRQAVDVAILEVGLGGRLDAVNIVDADLSLVTNIGLDHQDWLGTDRETIGREKAGIIRPQKPVVYNDSVPVKSLIDEAESSGSELYCLDRDYFSETVDGYWQWRYEDLCIEVSLGGQKLPGHQIQNAAGALMCLCIMKAHFSLDLSSLAVKMLTSFPSGRNEWRQVTGNLADFLVLMDVAHNAEAVETLAQQLFDRPCQGKTIAIYATLKDKPVERIASIMSPWIDEWLVAGLDAPRGCKVQELTGRLSAADISARPFGNPVEAWQHAMSRATSADRVIVFGSFYTVQAVMQAVDKTEVEKYSCLKS